MRFLVDAQLPPALARWLSSIGHPSDHVFDLGLASASDASIWDHAVAQGLILVSKDDDFVARRTLANDGPQIVWVRFGNVSRAETIARFERALPYLVSALEQGDMLIETA